MLNLNLINPKDLAEKIASIPQNKRDFLSSPGFLAKLSEIQKKHSLIKEAGQPEILEQLIVLFIAGFFPKKEFLENLEEFLYMDHDPALALEQDVLDLLKPVLPTETLTPTFAPIFTGQPPVVPKPTNTSPIPSVPKFVAPLRPSTPPPTPPSPTPAIPKEGTFIKPLAKKVEVSTPYAPNRGFTSRVPEEKPLATTDQPPAPFIIHERSEVKTTINQPSTGATRQTFIRPQFTPAKDSSPPPIARVQAGGTVFGQKDIAPKVVNYSATREPEVRPKPQTLRPAFAGKPQKTEEDANTINLRDLPK